MWRDNGDPQITNTEDKNRYKPVSKVAPKFNADWWRETNIYCAELSSRRKRWRPIFNFVLRQICVPEVRNLVEIQKSSGR